MPTPVVFTTLPDLQADTESKIYQNAQSAITGAIHQQSEVNQNASLWRQAALPLVLDPATGTFGLNPGVTAGNVYQWDGSQWVQTLATNLALTANAPLVINAGAMGWIAGTADGNMYQWNGTSWAQVQMKTSNTIWVDATYGNPATAQKYNPFRPYQSIDNAQTAAVAGDVIHVRPGAYTATRIGKNGVDWYFEPDAIVTGLIGDYGTSMTFVIYGQGQFTSSTANTLAQTNASTNITVFCKSITCTISGGTAASCAGGTQEIHGNLVSTGTFGNGAICSVGSQTLYGNSYGFYIGVSTAGTGKQYVYGNVSSATRAANVNGGNQYIYGNVTGPSAIYLASSGTMLVTGLATGTIVLYDSIVVCELAYKAVMPSAASIAGGATLILNGGARLVTTSGTNCAVSTGTIISYGAYSNLIANASITIQGTLNVGTYVQ